MFNDFGFAQYCHDLSNDVSSGPRDSASRLVSVEE